MYKLLLLILVFGLSSAIAEVQHKRLGSSFIGGGGGGTPGGIPTDLQYNTNSTFGGISGVTSDSASVGFATSSKLILYGQTAGNCLTVDSNSAVISQSCSAGSQTSIAAGTDITTSGSAGNVTVNVVATPSFTTVIASGNITAGTAQFTGAVSGTTAVFQTITDALLGGCLQATAGVISSTGVNCATQTATPSIAAGTNITTSGTAANTTVAVVGSPSFTNVTASSNITGATAQITGFLTAGGASLAGLTIQTETLSGNLTGTSANFSGNLTGTTAQFTGALTGTSAVFQTVTVSNLTPTGPNCLQEIGGVLQATNTGCATQTATPSIAAGTNITTSGSAANTTINVVATPSFTTVIATGNLTAATAQFSGLLTGTNAVFQTVTVNNLTPTGPNCLQETGGVLQATNAACATPTSVSIAQGNNIVTSGTATNITVTATPTGASNTVQFNNAGVFGGDSGFQYAGGASGIATLTLGNVTTTNARALSLIGTLSSSTVQFDAPFFMNITTSGFAVGSKLADVQASGISVFSVSPSGALSSAALSTAQCLQSSAGGLIFGTAVPCATQTSTPSIAAGSNITTSGTAANTTINVVATPSFTTVISTSNLTASTVLGVVGWLTAPGVNMQTATLAGNLTGTSANFSTNLTANIAQFAGFMSAGGASLSGLTINTETLSGALNGATANFTGNLTGTTANFSSNLTANIAQFAGFLSAGGASLSGLTIQTETLSSNLTGTTANFSSNLTGQIAAFPGFLTASGSNFNTTTVVGAFNGSTGNFTSTLTASIYTGTATGAGALAFISPTIALFGTSGVAATSGGWINWGGESRLSADKGLNISNAGLTPTALSVNVQGGRSYSIDGDLYATFAVAATGGIAIALTGTYGSTDTHYFGYVIDAGAATGANGTFENIRGATLATAKNTIVGNVVTSGTTGYVSIKGTISVSTSGTLLIAAATVNTQTAANGVSLTRGSRIMVHDMP